MSRIVFLVQAHLLPFQLRASVDQLLLVPQSAAVVHLDAKVDSVPFASALYDVADCRFTDVRHEVWWGGFGQVRASLELLRHGLASHPLAERFCLVSGDTYLLRHPAEVADILTRDPHAVHLNCVPFPAPQLGKAARRLSAFAREGPAGQRLPWSLVRRISYRPWRRRLQGMRPYTGSQWWTMSRTAAEFVVRRADELGSFNRLCATSHCPDELWFQTVLANSPFAPHLEPSLMLTRWETGRSSPRVLEVGDLADLDRDGLDVRDAYGAHTFCFARKFSDQTGACDSYLRERWSATARIGG